LFCGGDCRLEKATFKVRKEKNPLEPPQNTNLEQKFAEGVVSIAESFLVVTGGKSYSCKGGAAVVQVMGGKKRKDSVWREKNSTEKDGPSSKGNDEAGLPKEFFHCPGREGGEGSLLAGKKLKIPPKCIGNIPLGGHESKGKKGVLSRQERGDS